MITLYRKPIVTMAALVLAVSLTACGSNSSSTPTTIPESATIFYAHNLVFSNSSTVHATGYNAFGQLGIGSLVNQPSPLALSLRFNGAAAGGNHTVAFFNNSTVRTWGYNAFGQLGNNSTTYSSLPVPVFANTTGATPFRLSGIKAVAAGAFHSLALRNDDTLWAWGGNDAGQLGAATITAVNSSTFDLLYSTKPLMVAAAGVSFANISSIAANGKHSLARANGKVWAWGLNGTGQLGIDPHTTGALIVPTVVAGLPNGINGIAAGSAFNYAVDRSGFLWAWGNNLNGQLGNNSTVSTHVPVQVLTAPGVPLQNVVQAAAGIQHGLALDSSGNVWAWGYNHFGQLGNSSARDSLVAVRVLDSTGTAPLANVSEIRAFGSSSMARSNGAWYVWGDNSFGQLGTGTNGKYVLPVRMSNF